MEDHLSLCRRDRRGYRIGTLLSYACIELRCRVAIASELQKDDAWTMYIATLTAASFNSFGFLDSQIVHERQ
jgi:hypothetical protein